MPYPHRSPARSGASGAGARVCHLPLSGKVTDTPAHAKQAPPEDPRVQDLGSRTGAVCAAPFPAAGQGRTWRRDADFPRTTSPAQCQSPTHPFYPTRGKTKRGGGMSASRSCRRGSHRGGSRYPRPPSGPDTGKSDPGAAAGSTGPAPAPPGPAKQSEGLGPRGGGGTRAFPLGKANKLKGKNNNNKKKCPALPAASPRDAPSRSDRSEAKPVSATVNIPLNLFSAE